jgi:hypothetical protein
VASNPPTLNQSGTSFCKPSPICERRYGSFGNSSNNGRPSKAKARLNCEEFQHLNDEYERWRRVWARYAFPLPGQIPHGLDELKEEALLNRKITAKRMANHQKDCLSVGEASSAKGVRWQIAGGRN